MKVGLIEEPDLDRRHDRRHTALEQPARVGDWGLPRVRLTTLDPSAPARNKGGRGRESRGVLHRWAFLTHPSVADVSVPRTGGPLHSTDGGDVAACPLPRAFWAPVAAYGAEPSKTRRAWCRGRGLGEGHGVGEALDGDRLTGGNLQDPVRDEVVGPP